MTGKANVAIRTITPAEAHVLLGKNSNNRNLRRTRVDTYARDMKSNKWELNGDPIRLNGDGTLLDGQHRLHACIQADSPFTTVVVSGLGAASHKTIDVGLTRTFADELKWRGEAHVADLAAVVRLLAAYDSGTLLLPDVASRAELSGFLTKNARVRESLAYCVGEAKKIGLRSTAIIATHYLIFREHGQDLANAYADHLFGGTDYGDGDPCLAFRTYAMSASGNRLFRPTTTEWFAYSIKAANAWLLGRPVKTLKWGRVGKNRENFPVLVSPEEV